MGSLIGHVIPGSFFIIFSIWWSYITTIRYFQQSKISFNNKSLRKYKSTVSMPCICLPCSSLRRLPLESYLKLVFSLIGLIIEFTFGFQYVTPSQSRSDQLNDHHHQHHTKRDMANNTNVEMEVVLTFTKNNLQHTCMYFSFLLGSVVELLMIKHKWLPKNLDFVFGTAAFLIEALLFIFHLHGRSVLDVHVHTLLVLSISGCILFACLEIYNPREILLTFGRTGCTLLQGIWFCQVGIILYPPKCIINLLNKYNMIIENEHDLVMTITALFCFDILCIMIYLLTMGFFMKKCFIDWKLFEYQWDELLSFDYDDPDKNNRYFNGVELNGFMPLNNEEDDVEI